MKKLLFTPALALTIFSAPCQLEANDRHAFVVGVGEYKALSDLDNPARDAQLIARTLEKLDFKVFGNGPILDPGVNDLKRSFIRFSSLLDEGAEVVIYFSGHGAQIGGENLLIPTDFQLPSGDAAEAVRYSRLQSLTLNEILSTLEESKVSLSVLLLDCCRNPGSLAADAGLVPGGGFAANQNPKLGEGGEVLIGFAAKHGQFALDGEGDNSPYAASLAKWMALPGVSLRKAFDEVTAEVMETTQRIQQPFFYGSLTKDVYLAGVPSGREALTNAEAVGIGAPDTVDKLMAVIDPGNTHTYLRKLLGEPEYVAKESAKLLGKEVPIVSESYSTDFYWLNMLYAPAGAIAQGDQKVENPKELELVGYAMGLSEKGRPVAIYRGVPANTIFSLGKTTAAELWKESGPPEQTWFNECARYPRVVGEFYFGRLGHYYDWLVAAGSDLDGKLNPEAMNEPFRSYGAALDIEGAFELVAGHLAPAY